MKRFAVRIPRVVADATRRRERQTPPANAVACGASFALCVRMPAAARHTHHHQGGGRGREVWPYTAGEGGAPPPLPGYTGDGQSANRKCTEHTRHTTRVRAQVLVGLPWSRRFWYSGMPA